MSRKPIYSKTVPYRIISMPNDTWQLQTKRAEHGNHESDNWEGYARPTDLETAKGQLAAQEAKGSNQQMS